MTEKEKVQSLLDQLYVLLDKAQKDKPNDKALIDSLLDDINFARELLKR